MIANGRPVDPVTAGTWLTDHGDRVPDQAELPAGPSGARVVQAGVVPMDTAAVASEIQRSWNRDDAQQWAEVYTKIFPNYQLLIESYLKAQDVQKNHEPLDSQRS